MKGRPRTVPVLCSAAKNKQLNLTRLFLRTFPRITSGQWPGGKVVWFCLASNKCLGEVTLVPLFVAGAALGLLQ